MRVFKKPAASYTDASDAISRLLLVRIKPSMTLLAGVLLMHVCASFAVMFSALPLGVQFTCVACLSFLALDYYKQWCLRPCFRLLKNQNQQWVLRSDIDLDKSLVINTCYYWSRYLVIFRVSNNRLRCFYYPILMDSCDADSHRHLRVFAKYLL